VSGQNDTKRLNMNTLLRPYAFLGAISTDDDDDDDDDDDVDDDGGGGGDPYQ